MELILIMANLELNPSPFMPRSNMHRETNENQKEKEDWLQRPADGFQENYLQKVKGYPLPHIGTSGIDYYGPVWHVLLNNKKHEHDENTVWKKGFTVSKYISSTNG